MTKANYYVFSYTTNLKEVGSIDQVDDLIIPTDMKIFQSYNRANYDNPAEKIPDFTVLKFTRKAKPTDVITATKFLKPSNGFVISNKVKGVLEQFPQSNVRFFDAMVTDGNNNKHPYSMFVVGASPELVNFAASEMMITNSLGTKDIEPVAFTSYDNYKEKKKIIDWIRYKKLVLKESLDVIKVPAISGILISEQLKEALEKVGVTGISCDVIRPSIDIYIE